MHTQWKFNIEGARVRKAERQKTETGRATCRHRLTERERVREGEREKERERQPERRSNIDPDAIDRWRDAERQRGRRRRQAELHVDTD